ncbi:cyclin-T isoform X4 [Nasonia vitripennis]|nr:cyclin-T isoform X4 [Nasonia vitripennis]
MCLQYKPTVVACFCIHLACKWSNWEIPQSNEGKYWFWYVDKSVTSELLGQLTGEFLHIFDKCPSRLKRKIRSISANQSPNMNHPALSNSPFDAEPRKVQSPANADGSLSFQSSRPFHPDVKSETDASKRPSSSMSGRSSVDYREYREKKERAEREREKTSAASHSSSNTSLNADPSKHHSHHHKQSSSANVPSKHSSSSSSSSSIKQNVHHNHHHSSRQDVKSSSQIMQQRHSTSGSSGSSQPRDPNRDRQRIPREYNSSSNTSGGTVFSHHSLDNSLESALNNISQDSSTVHPPEKLSNSVHKPHDGRGNDLRHNSKPQQSQQQKDAKPYSKYPDSASATSRSSSASSSKKPDIFEQRSEEVRKLIEKPLPPVKPRAEVQKEEYAAMMLKQSHHPSKYGHQPEKPLPNANSTQSSESKMLNLGQTAFSIEKSPSAPVSASQISQKSMSVSKSSSSNSNLPVKNGSSSSASSLGLINNLDDIKTEKKPRGYLTAPVGDSDNTGLQNPPPPLTKHRSLFSPEKTPTPTPASSRESSHSRALKQKQRSSPAVPKQDLPSFTSPNAMQLTPELPHLKSQRLSNSVNTMSTSLQKQHRTQNNADTVSLDQESKQQLQMLEAHSRRFISSFDLNEQSSGLPDLMQPAKDNKSVTDVKPPPELVKSFENTDQMLMSNQRHKPQQQHHGLNNGLDGVSAKEYSTIDPSSFRFNSELPDELLSTEMPSDFMFMKPEPKMSDFLSLQDKVLEIRQESFSPLKSAQSINALLQEPLTLMPSLLHDQHQQTRDDDKSSLQTQLQQQQQQQVLPELPLPSTVDMSDLTGPVQCMVDIPVTTATAPIVPVESAPAVSTAPATQEEKKSEHRSKSEKKKKEKKHKHKEKDKSKDKHKHKHKDKDKEKEKHHRDKSDREKDNKTEEGNGSATSGNPSLGAVPIKITIPKDKLNLSCDSIGTSSSSTTSSSLKIKIPKERLKVNEVSQQQPQMQSQNMLPQQAPLKIKIRTDALARSTSDLQENSSRKREREVTESPIGAPPAKKQQPMQMQQRPNERQNGRHNSYGPGSTDKPDRYYEAVNVKTDSGEAVEGLTRKFVPTSYGSSPKFFS